MGDPERGEIASQGRSLVETEAGAELDAVGREGDSAGAGHADPVCKLQSTRNPSLPARARKRSTHSTAGASPASASSFMIGQAVSSI